MESPATNPVPVGGGSRPNFLQQLYAWVLHWADTRYGVAALAAIAEAGAAPAGTINLAAPPGGFRGSRHKPGPGIAKGEAFSPLARRRSPEVNRTAMCSGQLNPDTLLSRFSASAGGSPPLY